MYRPSREIYVSEQGYQVVLQGHGLGAIIGRRGETLDAIQQLTNYSVNRSQSKRVRIHVDAEGLSCQAGGVPPAPGGQGGRKSGSSTGRI